MSTTQGKQRSKLLESGEEQPTPKIEYQKPEKGFGSAGLKNWDEVADCTEELKKELEKLRKVSEQSIPSEPDLSPS